MKAWKKGAGLTYEEVLQWIHSIGRFGIRPGLERMNALMERLGNPHHQFRCIHIAGTNGKGSTAVFITSVLQSAGYRVGLYTSPYLETFSNRISMDDRDIPPETLVANVNKVRPLVEEFSRTPGLGPLTQFEVVTSIAFNYYAGAAPDLVVIEAGLGGRLDATNIVSPLLTVITNVSRDHVNILGSTLEEVACEKAGVIKERVPLFTAAHDPIALRILRERAAEKKAPLYCVVPAGETSSPDACRGVVEYGRRQIIPEGQMFDCHGLKNDYREVFIPLRGEYQVENATLAIGVVEYLRDHGFATDEKAIKAGLKIARWPGRLEVLQEKPRVVIDAAHNTAAVKAMIKAIHEHFSCRRLIVVVGIMEDKDAREMLSLLMEAADDIVLTRPAIERAATPQRLKAIVEDLGVEGVSPLIEPDLNGAIRRVLSLAGPDDMVLVTGSIYTISEARALFIKKN
jgi:dihydrofolate synthase/folylpolyglutamate synthase